jgi:PAS domain S-box-containing protein
MAKHTEKNNVETKYLSTFGEETIYACRIEGDKFIPTFLSHGFIECFGYDADEALGDPQWWGDHLHPDEKEQLIEEMAREIFKKGVYTHEYRIRCKDNTYRWIYDRLRLIRNEEDEPIEIVGCWLDITEFK